MLERYNKLNHRIIVPTISMLFYIAIFINEKLLSSTFYRGNSPSNPLSLSICFVPRTLTHFSTIASHSNVPLFYSSCN